MPVFTVQIPVISIVSITVDAPDADTATMINIAGLDKEPIYQTHNGIDADDDRFSIAWLGKDGYSFEKASATPADPEESFQDEDVVFVGFDGDVYPDRESRDAALSDEDED